MAFVSARLIYPCTVETLAYHGSAHIHAIAHADGWIIFPVGVAELEEGSLVDFWML